MYVFCKREQTMQLNPQIKSVYCVSKHTRSSRWSLFGLIRAVGSGADNQGRNSAPPHTHVLDEETSSRCEMESVAYKAVSQTVFASVWLTFCADSCQGGRSELKVREEEKFGFNFYILFSTVAGYLTMLAVILLHLWSSWRDIVYLVSPWAHAGWIM